MLRAAARFHARRNDPDACALSALGAALAFDACHEPRLATEARATGAGVCSTGRARAALKALLAVEGPPAPRADAARAAAVAAVAKFCGDEETYEACARAAGDALPRCHEALAGAPSWTTARRRRSWSTPSTRGCRSLLIWGTWRRSLLVNCVHSITTNPIHTDPRYSTDSPRRSSVWWSPCSRTSGSSRCGVRGAGRRRRMPRLAGRGGWGALPT